MSMKPGETTSCEASTRCPAWAAWRSPIAAILSPMTPMSARNHGAPVPSTTRPPAMMTSNGVADCPDSSSV